MIYSHLLAQAEQLTTISRGSCYEWSRQWTVRVCSAPTSWFHLIELDRGSFQKILSRRAPISQIDRQQRTVCTHTIPAVTHATTKVKRQSIVVYSYQLSCGCARYRHGHSVRYILVMSRIRNGSVHTEFIALHLVELVPGVRILTRSDYRGSNVQILVKILPAHLTWTHTHTHTHIKHTANSHSSKTSCVSGFTLFVVWLWVLRKDGGTYVF